MNENIYVDVNIIQTLPPNCVNRDDTGSPKTCKYGGVTRSRVSSQAWKKAVRDDFKNTLPAESVGSRTMKIVDFVKKEIQLLDETMPEDKAEKAAIKALENAGLKIKNPKDGTGALTFVSQGQAKALARLAVEKETDKKKYKAAFAENPSNDMALFGRMVASDPSLNFDACCQVAHAISTHKVANEYDYFTAVDDEQAADNAGAGHIGVTEFNSSTLYRFATINVKELYKTVGQETGDVVKAFVESFVKSMPTGKQNSFANRTVPSAIYIAVRQDQPLSLAGAFEKPVRQTEEGYEEASEKALVKYAKKLYADGIVSEPYQAITVGEGLRELSENITFSQALEQLKQTVDSLLPQGV